MTLSMSVMNSESIRCVEFLIHYSRKLIFIVLKELVPWEPMRLFIIVECNI